MNGIIRLGQLNDITDITTPENSWIIDSDEDARTFVPSIVQEYADVEIRIPVSGNVTEKWDVILVETGHDETVLTDQTAKLDIHDHEIVISTGLNPGNYRLYMDTTFNVTVVKFRIVQPALPPTNTDLPSYRLGHMRYLEATIFRPLNIASVIVKNEPGSDETIVVQLQNYSPTHTLSFATISRAIPQKLHRLDTVLGMTDTEPGGRIMDVLDEESTFLDGRMLSDEYQYILERSRSNNWTGHVLKKPMILLKPYVSFPIIFKGHFC